MKYESPDTAKSEINRKYAVEWINNLTTEQLSYFEKEMLKSIII